MGQDVPVRFTVAFTVKYFGGAVKIRSVTDENNII